MSETAEEKKMAAETELLEAQAKLINAQAVEVENRNKS